MFIPALFNSFSTKQFLRHPWAFFTCKMQKVLPVFKLYFSQLVWIPQTLQTDCMALTTAHSPCQGT